jgi:glutathionylspermidine amidase/synthetase
MSIGQSYQTQAFSNCHGDCVKQESNVILFSDEKKIVTGMRWQCVEYARRWLINQKSVTFAEVQYAYQIWDLNEGQRVDTEQPVPLLKFENRISKTAPQVGDLLIYSVDFAVTGHVAVVVGVHRNSILVAEQNYFNHVWDRPNFSRRLLLEKEGHYRVFDDSLIGWVRFQSN